MQTQNTVTIYYTIYTRVFNRSELNGNSLQNFLLVLFFYMGEASRLICLPQYLTDKLYIKTRSLEHLQLITWTKTTVENFAIYLRSIALDYKQVSIEIQLSDLNENQTENRCVTEPVIYSVIERKLQSYRYFKYKIYFELVHIYFKIVSSYFCEICYEYFSFHILFIHKRVCILILLRENSAYLNIYSMMATVGFPERLLECTCRDHNRWNINFDYHENIFSVLRVCLLTFTI